MGSALARPPQGAWQDPGPAAPSTDLVTAVITSITSMIVVPVLVLTPFIVLFELGLYERLSGRRLPEPARA